MFTGIIEELGQVVAFTQLGDAARLEVSGPVVTQDARAGDSVAVNGVCLTAVGIGEGRFSADVMAETLHRSSLGDLQVGDRVNLERPVAIGGRLGGHMVQGHVDGVGTVLSRTPAEHWELVRIGFPEELARYIVVKGSIAIDGVSLTVVEIESGGTHGPWLSVSLIPTTLSMTTLGNCAPGSSVNLEVDIIGKYVERLLEGRS